MQRIVLKKLPCRVKCAVFRGSSVVEQRAVNALVAGSNPARGAMNTNIKFTIGAVVIVALLITLAVTLGGNKATSPEQDMMAMESHDDMDVVDDKTFLLHMIPHHQEAVDTANEVLERGGVLPEVEELVENIIVAQEKEIADMKAWYQEWYGEEYQDAGVYEPMMRELAGLSGKELDLVFTEDMWMHHMGALHMADAVLKTTDRPELKTLGNNILITQREEMLLMQEILAKHKED